MRAGYTLVTILGIGLLGGCATSSITNLTPRSQSRSAENVYPVEIEFESNLRSIQRDTIRPYVQIGDDNYLMRKIPVVKNRWETLIPVPAGKKLVNYRVKVDFRYNAMPEPSVNSVLSAPYQLQIAE
jgi:hypothetical protein